MAVGAILGKSANSGGGSGSGRTLGISQDLNGFIHINFLLNNKNKMNRMTDTAKGNGRYNRHYCFWLKDFVAIFQYYSNSSDTRYFDLFIYDRKNGFLLKESSSLGQPNDPYIDGWAFCNYWIKENILLSLGNSNNGSQIKTYTFTNGAPFVTVETFTCPNTLIDNTAVSFIGDSYYFIGALSTAPNNEKIIRFDYLTKRFTVMSQTISNLGYAIDSRMSSVPYDETRVAIYGYDNAKTMRAILWNPTTGIVEDITTTKIGLMNLLQYATFSSLTKVKDKGAVDPFWFKDNLLIVHNNGNNFMVYDKQNDEARLCSYVGRTSEFGTSGQSNDVQMYDNDFLSVTSYASGSEYTPITTRDYFSLKVDFDSCYEKGIRLGKDIKVVDTINASSPYQKIIFLLAKTKVRFIFNMDIDIVVQFNRLMDWQAVQLTPDEEGYYEIPYDGYFRIISFKPFASVSTEVAQIVYITK